MVSPSKMTGFGWLGPLSSEPRMFAPQKLGVLWYLFDAGDELKTFILYHMVRRIQAGSERPNANTF